MGEHKLNSVMETLAQTLPLDGKRISNHFTRKSVVAKLKKAGQPRHKIIQITGHANESSLDDYDEIVKKERRTVPHNKRVFWNAHKNSDYRNTAELKFIVSSA